MIKNKVLSLQEIAELTQSRLVGHPHHLIYNVADLETATEQDASFLANLRYKQLLDTSKAGVIFVDPNIDLLEGHHYLITEHPSIAFQKLIDFFHPARKQPSAFIGIHPTAVIHPTAQLEHNVTVGPYAVIDEYVTIKEGTFVGSSVYIGPYCQIGRDCLIHPRATIREESFLGNRVVIQPGAVIGSCGFGYSTDKQGKHTKLNQVGNVVLEDDVEVGANTTIDRARFKSTIIGTGTKIDNLVQLGHGARTGSHCLLVAQVGIAGSTTLGNHVILAGQVAVNGHIHLDDGVIVAGKSGVSKSLKRGRYNGIPATDADKYNRQAVLLRNIETYVKQIKMLQEKIQQLEKKLEYVTPSN